MLNLPFQIFCLALRYLTEEENSSQCLKILTQITIEDKNELAEIRGFRPKKITSKSFDNDNKLTLKSFFAFCSVFFLQGPTEERWRRLMSSFQNTPELKELKLNTALLVLTEQRFSTWRICFHFLGNLLVCAIVFVSQ